MQLIAHLFYACAVCRFDSVDAVVAPDTRTAGNSLVDGSRQVSKDYLKPPPIGYKIVLPSPSKTIIVFYWSRVKVLLWVSS